MKLLILKQIILFLFLLWITFSHHLIILLHKTFSHLLYYMT